MLSWIKKNKLSSVLLAIIIIFTFSRIIGVSRSFSGVSYNARSLSKMSVSESAPAMGIGGADMAMEILPPVPEAPPQITPDRMVISESSLSLQVKDVPQSRDAIINLANTNGGYMVNSNTSNPGEAPSATVIIRVAADKMNEVLGAIRKLGLKVVSENLSGYDVTDQYVDIEKRIGYLKQAIEQYQNILKQSREVSDIANLTERIISTQQQVDNLAGQQEYLKQNAKLAKIIVYLSTDDLSLPYAPSDTWRPEVIFKMAVRSLVGHLRSLADAAIWLGVYAVFWLPVIAVILYVRWKRNQ